MHALKTNNRFYSLLEDNRPVRTRQVDASRYINKFKTDTKINHANINMNDFPALIDARANAKVDDVKPNYVTKLLYQPNIEPVTGAVIPYGWVVITPNKYMTHIKSSKSSKPTNPNWDNAMDSLVKLYNKRKDEYIAMWGEETYEKVFLFPNYDYDYYEDEDEDDEDYDYDDDEYEDYDDDKYYN